MNAPALKVVQPEMRRFVLPDLDTHGHWLIPRLMAAYPQLSQRYLIGWIRNLLYDNSFLFLFQDHGVALFHCCRHLSCCNWTGGHDFGGSVCCGR